jgi:DNA-binding MarR family transcriptional regulator
MSFYEFLEMKFCKIYRKKFEKANGALELLGISSSLSILLININRTPGLTQNQLKDFLNLDKTTISKNLKVLEDKKLIKKITNPEDKRSFRIFSSAKGKKTAESAKVILEKIWKKELSTLSNQELEIFDKILNKILNNL